MKPRFSRLHTLAEVNAVPHAEAKPPKLVSRLEKAIANKAARLEDAAKLRAWALKVKDRDQWRDRRTRVTVRRTRALDPLRAEAHHVEPKANKATRYDVRNGVTLSLANHLAVEANQLRIEGTVFYYLNGCKYINANCPVYFVRVS